MADERTEFGFKRIECACSACLRNCYGLPGYLVPSDLRRIADYLGEDDIVRFTLDNLLASPGALVVAHGEIFAIPTIVPARRLDGACCFLKNDLCSIHAVNPFGCAFFSAEQTKEQSDAISARGLMEIMKSWRQGDRLFFVPPKRRHHHSAFLAGKSALRHITSQVSWLK
jgi:hypothetical protein